MNVAECYFFKFAQLNGGMHQCSFWLSPSLEIYHFLSFFFYLSLMFFLSSSHPFSMICSYSLTFLLFHTIFTSKGLYLFVVFFCHYLSILSNHLPMYGIFSTTLSLSLPLCLSVTLRLAQSQKGKVDNNVLGGQPPATI